MARLPLLPPKLILASASPRRLDLLRQVCIVPDLVQPADIDEALHKDELPLHYARRIALHKAKTVAAQFSHDVILAADTVVCMGRRVLPKAEDEVTARLCLTRLSGRRHRVITAVALAQGKHCKLHAVETAVRFRILNKHDIDAYLASGQWQGKAGGYAIQGLASSFIPWINGSYSNVVGLPLAETVTWLKSFREAIAHL